MTIFPHGSRNPSTLVFPFNSPFLITGTPKHHTRMITVAFYHALEKAHVLFVDTRQPVFFNNQYTQLIASIQHLGSHRIMAGTISIGTQFLQLLQTEILQSIRNAGTYTSMVLMHVESFHLYCFTIQQEALVCMEFDVTDTGTSGIDIHQLICLINLSPNGI